MNQTPTRVAFVLDQKIRESFLPQFDRSTFPGIDDVRVDVAGFGPADWERLLREERPEVVVSGWGTSRIPMEIACLPDLSLRYICHLTGTVRSMVPRELVERGVLVTNWGSAISHTIAEHAILLVLGSLRGMALWKSCMDDTKSGSDVAARILHTRSLKGRKVGIHGFGSIVRNIVLMLQPFGVTISACSAGVPEEIFMQHGVRPCPTLEELFATSEVLIECEALTPQTEGTVTEALIALLPDQTVFVNVGRGRVVDEAALAKAAAAGRIRVALDVFQAEPLPRDSPLRLVPDALLSPHCAGPTHDAYPLCGDFAMENLRRYLAGNRDRMQGIVTLEIYDRIT